MDKTKQQVDVLFGRGIVVFAETTSMAIRHRPGRMYASPLYEEVQMYLGRSDRMNKYGLLLALLGCIMLSGCAGSGTIREYSVINGKEILKSITKFKGRNIKARTKDGAEIETKSWELPALPSTIIGR